MSKTKFNAGDVISEYVTFVHEKAVRNSISLLGYDSQDFKNAYIKESVKSTLSYLDLSDEQLARLVRSSV